MREKGSLAGANAIVTGASSGIGYGIASRLAADGAAVAINYHSQREPAEQLRGEIERSGGRGGLHAKRGSRSYVRAVRPRGRFRSAGGQRGGAQLGLSRDASFTIYAFMRLGYVDEAEQFRRWIGDRATSAVGGELRIMYALNGNVTPDKTELDHLAGYGGARPVRIGNATHKQRQLDVYGELIDSIYLANKYGTAVSNEA
jgi:hypothetical protein